MRRSFLSEQGGHTFAIVNYMSAIIILVFISMAVAGIFLFLFYKAVNKGQYEEFESPAVRALSDDELISHSDKN